MSIRFEIGKIYKTSGTGDWPSYFRVEARTEKTVTLRRIYKGGVEDRETHRRSIRLDPTSIGDIEWVLLLGNYSRAPTLDATNEVD